MEMSHASLALIQMHLTTCAITGILRKAIESISIPTGNF
jgi:hypothetical protein